MSDPFAGNGAPKPALAGLGLLIALALTLTIWGSNRSSLNDADASQPSTTNVSRLLLFDDVGSGVLDIIDADSGQLISRIDAGQENFIRGVVRGLARERRSLDIDGSVPLVLSMMDDGSLQLEDPGTGQVIVLDAFGQTNRASFARLLETVDDDRRHAMAQGQGP